MSRSLKAHLSPVWLRLFDLEVTHGAGVYLYAADGRRYLDFTSGIAVTNTGHCHPKVVAAVQEQAARLLHGQANTEEVVAGAEGPQHQPYHRRASGSVGPVRF